MCEGCGHPTLTPVLDTSAGWIVRYLRLFIRRGGNRNGGLAERSGRRSGVCRRVPDHEILKNGWPFGVNERVPCSKLEAPSQAMFVVALAVL